jgi:hypothetical protein
MTSSTISVLGDSPRGLSPKDLAWIAWAEESNAGGRRRSANARTSIAAVQKMPMPM